MFESETLKEHLQTSSSINSKALILGEWNMNLAENVEAVGNYRFRPTALAESADSVYSRIIDYYDNNDSKNEIQFYTGATNADIVIDGGLDSEDQPQSFISIKEKEKQLYSLEECLGRFRPRSGINKARFFDGSFLNFENVDMFSRPRFYMGHKDDTFKYWSSFRTESGIERGISKTVNAKHFIDDAAPFVVYKEPVASNRIVVKMQSGVGEIDLGPFRTSYSSISDPFFGYENQSTPSNWKIQYLENNKWVDAIQFDPNIIRANGQNVIGPDGYVEISYGMIIPEAFRSTLNLVGKYSLASLLPSDAEINEAYLVGSSNTSAGMVYVWTGTQYESFNAEYGWFLREETDASTAGVAFELVNSEYFTVSGKRTYREVSYISGIRIVVEAMNKKDSSFDLIEMSPRLVVDLTDRTKSFSITKSASDLGISGMPVGQLLASVGNISMFDYDSAFNKNNLNSLVSSVSSQNLKVTFYEDIKDLSNRYLVPIKTLYAEGFPTTSVQERDVSISLRDLFFRIESLEAPELFLQNVSMSFAIAVLLDSIGFSNYVFKRLDGEADTIIPAFFVSPGKTVAQVLQDIALSTQTAMFFDEYNNLVMMTKGYLMPGENDRQTDIILRGSKDFEVSGANKNSRTNIELANIKSISSVINNLYNDGTIRYYARHIQRSYGSLRQSLLIDKDKSWNYKPVLLWEVGATEKTKSQGDDSGQQSAYTLSAIPLNSDLSANLPEVVDNQIINNTIDFGEGIYWLARYNGYFYSNGEVIKYDAAEYSVAGVGDVWISSAQEYNKYFSALPFNGKMYPTGSLRIFSEPEYFLLDESVVLKNGIIAKNGRGQFGTAVSEHKAGLDIYWSNTDPLTTPVRGCKMYSKFLFSKIKKFTISNAYSEIFEDKERIYVPDVTRISTGLTVISIEGYGAFASDSKVVETNPAENWFSVDKPLLLPISKPKATDVGVINTLEFSENIKTTSGIAGQANDIASGMTRSGILKNFLSSSNITESQANKFYATKSGTIQSSALIMQGPEFAVGQEPIDFVTYLHKPLNDKFSHFGTRMRIIGRVSGSDGKQLPNGSMPYYSAEKALSDQSISISGGSGGLGVMVDPKTNSGYYFEIISLTENNLKPYSNSEDLHNVVFYKIERNAESATTDSSSAIPTKLWGGFAPIVVDDGLFTGQSRIFSEENVTVYDLSVEYIKTDQGLKFYLYINDRLISVVEDTSALPIRSEMALFVRGTSRVMFENIFAISNNYSQNAVGEIDVPMALVFSNQEVTTNNSFKKYAMSEIVQNTYLSGLGGSDPSKYLMYFEEFGTIMREAAYFNIKYDKAYPALYAQISPTFNNIRGYTVSNFTAGAYGAEFLVFNSTDAPLNLDETTGNYLRIQGVTFTQQTQYDLTVDEYFGAKSDFSTTLFENDTIIEEANRAKIAKVDIQLNRLSYGRKEFSIDPLYIQSEDAANELMAWMVSKTMSERKSIGIDVFGLPTIQLGDIVSIDYKDSSGIDEIAKITDRFVVYNIEYSRDSSGPSTSIYLSEVK